MHLSYFNPIERAVDSRCSSFPCWRVSNPDLLFFPQNSEIRGDTHRTQARVRSMNIFHDPNPPQLPSLETFPMAGSDQVGHFRAGCPHAVQHHQHSRWSRVQEDSWENRWENLWKNPCVSGLGYRNPQFDARETAMQH